MELLGWIFILSDIDGGEWCVRKKSIFISDRRLILIREMLSIIGLEIFLYYSFFPPVVYLVFMARFFQTGEHWPLMRKPDLLEDETPDSEVDDSEQKRRLERRRELQRWMAAQELEGRRRQVQRRISITSVISKLTARPVLGIGKR